MSYEWSKFGLHIPEILLPKEGTDYYKWSVVACDQYTSEPEYWDEAKKIVGDAPSTLNLMLPELYLGGADEGNRVLDINSTMKKYLEKGILEKLEPGCIFVERESEGHKRLGLVICTDLEAYDFSEGSKSLTRATEGTVIERIPPRLKVREGAIIEMPHIIILIDDPEKTVIEPLAKLDGKVVYDTDLMLKGGHIKGKFLTESQLDNMKDALSKLFDSAEEKYGKGHMIFQAMGDGNHSLATAKTNWERIKKNLSPEEIENHPARFALCEIENVHDNGIVFEPIHRVVFAKKNVIAEKIVEDTIEKLKEQNGEVILSNEKEQAPKGGFAIPILYKGEEKTIVIKTPKHKIAVGSLQAALDAIINENDGVEIDYVHGTDSVKKLVSNSENVGFLLPSMSKFDLFPAVASDGVLPRKTFSMGEANEKRYYIESRYIGKFEK